MLRKLVATSASHPKLFSIHSVQRGGRTFHSGFEKKAALSSSWPSVETIFVVVFVVVVEISSFINTLKVGYSGPKILLSKRRVLCAIGCGSTLPSVRRKTGTFSRNSNLIFLFFTRQDA